MCFILLPLSESVAWSSKSGDPLAAGTKWKAQSCTTELWEGSTILYGAITLNVLKDYLFIYLNLWILFSLLSKPRTLIKWGWNWGLRLTVKLVYPCYVWLSFAQITENYTLFLRKEQFWFGGDKSVNERRGTRNFLAILSPIPTSINGQRESRVCNSKTNFQIAYLTLKSAKCVLLYVFNSWPLIIIR